MTSTNWLTTYTCGVRQWYFLMLLWSCIRPHALCPTGTFKSDFLGGECVTCPPKLKFCENEEFGDSVRCFKACSKLRQKLTTTSTPALVETSKTMTSTSQPRTSTEPCAEGKYRSDYLFIGACTPCPKSLSQCDYQQTDDRRRCRLACGRQATTSPTSGGDSESTQTSKPSGFFKNTGGTFENNKELDQTSQNDRSGQHNWTEITVGILFSVSALIILVFVSIFIVMCWRRRSPADQPRRNDYYTQAPVLVSNSDTDQELGNADQTAVDVESIGSSMALSSVSHEDFANMVESQL